MQEGATTTFSLSFLLALNATLMEKQNRVESLQWWWHSPTKSRTCTRASTVQHSPVQAAEQSRAVTHTSPAAVFQSVYAKIFQPCNKFGKNETKVKANFFTMKNTVKVIKKTFLTNCLVYYTVKTNSKERFMKWNIKIIIERSSVSHETLMQWPPKHFLQINWKIPYLLSSQKCYNLIFLKAVKNENWNPDITLDF